MRDKLYKARIGSIAITALMAGIMFFSSCKDDKDESTKPEITSIGNGSANIGEEVTITGKNFSNEKSKVSVFFGETSADVTSTSTTSIVTTVPEMSTGAVQVSVSVSGETSNKYTFTVNVKSMVLGGFSPGTIKYDSVLTITGENFTEGIAVYVNGKEQTKDKKVLENGTKITVRMASKTYSGKVELVRGTEKATFDKELKYELTPGIVSVFSELSGGRGIAVDKENNVYLSHDQGLLKLNSSGTLVCTIDKCDENPEPSGLFLDNVGTLYAVETYGAIMKMVNNQLDTIYNNSSLTFNQVDGDNNGNLYFTTISTNKVLKYNIAGGQAPTELATLENGCDGILIVGDSIYVTTDKELVKMKVDGTGQTILVNDYILQNTGLCLYPSGDIFVTGGGFGNLYLLKSGMALEEFVPETEMKKAGNVYALTPDNNGDLLVSGNNLILKITIN